MIEENLKNFSKKERSFLSRCQCGLCKMPLNKKYCGALFDDCGIEIRNKRRLDCLKAYKPRKSKEEKFVEELFK